jgi:tetratricopeptide (TPR) repeat protein
VGAILLAGIWFGRDFFATHPIPEVDASKLSPKAAEALAARQSEVREHPRSGGAWGRLGMLLDAYDYDVESLACFVEAERRESTNPRWPYFQSLLLRSQDPEQALNKLRRTVALCGNQPEMPRYRLAKSLAERGQWAGAFSELEALLVTHPRFAPAILLRALGEQAQGRFSEAAQLGEKCVQDARTRKAAWALISLCQRQLGNLASAEEAGRQASQSPDDQAVDDLFQSEVDSLRLDHRVFSLPAHTLLAAGKLTEAAPLVQRLVSEYPEEAETWLVAGRYQILSGQLKEAEQSLRRHVGLDSGSVQGHFQLGMSLLKQDRHGEAAQVFERCTVLKPDFGPAFFNRAFCLARAGQKKEAIPLFQQVLRLSPEHLETYLLLGDLYVQQGQYQEATALLDQAEALRGGDPRLKSLRAKLEKSLRK